MRTVGTRIYHTPNLVSKSLLGNVCWLPMRTVGTRIYHTPNLVSKPLLGNVCWLPNRGLVNRNGNEKVFVVFSVFRRQIAFYILLLYFFSLFFSLWISLQSLSTSRKLTFPLPIMGISSNI